MHIPEACSVHIVSLLVGMSTSMCCQGEYTAMTIKSTDAADLADKRARATGTLLKMEVDATFVVTGVPDRARSSPPFGGEERTRSVQLLGYNARTTCLWNGHWSRLLRGQYTISGSLGCSPPAIFTQ